jgi:hypothetical protein
VSVYDLCQHFEIIKEDGFDYRDREAFEKCSILFKFKEGDEFNRRHTLSVSRIKI